MSRLRIILSLVAWLVAPACAMAEVVADVDPSAEEQDVSDSLEEFIDQAVDAGLLSVPGSLEAVANADETASDAAACQTAYPLDFSEYQEVRLYVDIAPYREAVTTEGQGVNSIPLVKAYLALGLYSEVIATLGKADNISARAYIGVARLMDGYLQAEKTVFSELADCYVDSELWLGISALAFKDVSGASLLERHVQGFRNLPFQLRSDVAALVLPTLRYNGNTLLGEKLLATFTQEEIAQSPRLNIQAAFLEVGYTYTDDFQGAYDFLSRTAPGVGELLSGVAAWPSQETAQQAIVTEQAYKVLSRSADDRDIAAALEFVLEDLRQRSNYSEFIKLLARPNLAASDFQFEIKERLAEQLLVDLKSESHTAKFSAIDMLANHPDIISGHSAEIDIISTAVDFLKTQGRASMAEALLRPEALDSTELLLATRLAYAREETEALYEMAMANMDRPDITYLGALAAVQRRDAERFRQFESYLPQQIEPLLELAEEDAIAGGWLLSEQTYEAVRNIAEPDQLARLESVLTLKALSESPTVSFAPRSIGNRLADSSIMLNQLEEGVR